MRPKDTSRNPLLEAKIVRGGEDALAKLYFFEGRNTGIYAESAKAARDKCKRGCGKLVKVLVDKTPPKGGGWDRTRKDGKSPAKSKYGKGRGKGPPRA